MPLIMKTMDQKSMSTNPTKEIDRYSYMIMKMILWNQSFGLISFDSTDFNDDHDVLEESTVAKVFVK